MIRNGIGVSKGYAIGTAYRISGSDEINFCATSENTAMEEKRLREAVERSKLQVKRIAEGAQQNLDAKNAEIIESHLNFLEDPAFTGEAFKKIREDSLTAEKAISDVTQSLYEMFSEFEDEYTRDRAADIKDIGERILRNLLGKEEDINFKDLPQNTVLFAHDLKPSDTAQIDREKVVAFVTEKGGKTSHTAILAKALGIAAVVGCDGILHEVEDGMPVLVDGVSGQVIVSPDEATIQKYKSLQAEEKSRKEKYANFLNQRITTEEGRKVLVAANIGGLEDLKTALENGAEGVGLFRTEFLYMNRQTMPTEEEQFQVYRDAAQLLQGKPLTIRTLDIGGDKSLPYLKMQKESNPFLGLRAIRLCLKNQDIFRTQLRAILRASVYGNIQIMFPMIGSDEELKQAKEVLDRCKRELGEEGVNYDPHILTGMMIEVPSAAIMAADFAKNVNFFSIGTNDLTQYTLAVDRMNETISGLYNSMHPAVLRLIKMTIEAAHQAFIPCCMCGELASDEKAIPLLLQYGLDEFSVSPGALADTKVRLLKAIGN
ncbi:phosphoenolpyruvate--protein phosphotransferase [Caproicibacter sp. BJN0012]|uniref:phosphoenolpyruvate--protein phosphotransferase n=1 Tax=Caproicibacter sp. BJN0012 TaxID=3110227 RepID=UPI002E12EAFC|nr:phosphoenolpyruvate--protein phosphotransferase [Caproicibacter sp. BJN0012]